MYTDKELIKLLRQKAKKLGRIPTSTDIRKDKKLPSISYYRRRFGSWVKALKASRLTPLPAKISRNISRKAEIVIRDKLRGMRYKVEDIRGSNPKAPYSLLVDNKIKLQVSGSIWKKKERGGRVNLYWNFSGRKERKFHYAIGVGMDERKRVKALFVFPKRKLSVKTSICVPVHSPGKYSQFRVTDLRDTLPLRKRRR